jgi:hypothetical protein
VKTRQTLLESGACVIYAGDSLFSVDVHLRNQNLTGYDKGKRV